MTRTININLGGLLFHMDDKAYSLLNSYLLTIEKQLHNDPSRKEIMADVESRIAELFNERKHRDSEVITLEDVNAVISVMGEPDSFGSYQEPTVGSGYKSQAIHQKRLYRDPDERVLGGVCSGLSAYFDIEVWIFRVLFIIFTFFFLSSIVVYGILWIVVPEANTPEQKLETRGEPVTIENLKRTVKEEFEKVKRNLNL
jgi:phage shock protein PspC (stress-responsive transcriptional regulator)